MTTLCSDVQRKKAEWEMVANDDPNVTEARAPHERKADCSIKVTESGMTMERRLEHPENTLRTMVVRESGSDTVTTAGEPEKAPKTSVQLRALRATHARKGAWPWAVQQPPRAAAMDVHAVASSERSNGFG